MKNVVCALILIFFNQLVFGHDIGVSKTELIEIKANHYLLRVISTERARSLFASPALPQTCEFTSNPNGEIVNEWLSYYFSCKTRLTAENVIILPWDRDAIMLTVVWENNYKNTNLLKQYAGEITINLSEFNASSGSYAVAAMRYFKLGVEHILVGVDHLLFVLMLLLLVRSTWVLVQTITAFTIAHSITLALSTFKVVNLPIQPVECVIALSIIFLCIEVIHSLRGKYGVTYYFPWVVAFSFGLLHGFGFASVLSSIGLPHSEIPISLLFFNLGVEAGQLLFVFIAYLLLALIRKMNFIEMARLKMIISYMAGSVACYWLVTRL